MQTRLYEDKLANHKLFIDIKKSFSENSSDKLCNLMELKDEVLYIWNFTENCLCCVNLKHLDEHDEETPYQKLHLVSPPAFSVEHLISSDCGTRLCLWGSRGVTIAELPFRWGRGGLFESGNQTVLCKSHSLDERFLYSQGDIQQVHWHPSSLSHVLVLVSDNTMRLYNIAVKGGPKLVKILTIGPKPSGAVSRTVHDSLGDTAVDFTTMPNSDHLLILTGNGEVYMTQCDLDNKSSLQAKIKGPLAMYPPAEDNYGSESCSIITVGGVDTPVLVVIASVSAALYHCLLLPDSTANAEGDGYALYVVESVELNVANTQESEMKYVYPVQLYPCTRNTYACLHANGVHSVTLPILESLREYAAADDGEMECALSGLVQKRSAARHLVCTGGARALRGLAASPAPLPRLLLLARAGDLLARTLEPYGIEEQLYKEIQLRNPALEQDEINNILKEKQKLSFTSIIQDILARDTSQPILKLDMKEEPSPKEMLELASGATSGVLRGEYLQRQRRALDAAVRKADALAALARQQDTWLADLQTEINNLRIQSKHLKQKQTLAEKYQDDMKHRCSAAVRALRARSAHGPLERRTLAELRTLAEHTLALTQRLAALKDYAHCRDNQLKKLQEDYKKETVLGRSHSDTISSVLQQQTKQISTLIEETKLLKDQLGVV